MSKINGHKFSKTLFLIVVGLLFLPAVQMHFKFIEIEPLGGAVEKAEKTSLTSENWLDETYQSTTEQYLNQNFGFRNVLVRIYNQLTFWFYKKTTARNVIVGKQNYLYEKNYIDSYYGRNYIGDSLIFERVKRLKAIQRVLADSGKLFFIAVAPGKGYFFPEYIPDYLRGERGQTNYETYLQEAKNQGVNLLDFNNLFVLMKDTASLPLYPKSGIHWSHYGANVFMDSIIRFIESQQGLDLPDFNVTGYSLSTAYRKPDTDVEKGMNLLFPIENYPMAYTDVEVIQKGKTKPKIMVVADSFFWQIFHLQVMNDVFNNGEFWYYNQQIIKPSSLDAQYVMMVDQHKKILEKDIIILLATEANLNQFPWGFDELGYEQLVNYDEFLKRKKQEKIEEIMKTIRGSEDWLKLIAKKAVDRGIPLDSMLRVDAKYLYESQPEKYK